MDSTVEVGIQSKYQLLIGILDERGRRLWAAVEAQQLGRGGVAAVARATGLSRTTIHQGLDELRRPQGVRAIARERMRAPGGGRKRLVEKDPLLLERLEWLVDPLTRGDPQSPLRWTLKSTRQLAEVLSSQGHSVGRQKVSELLGELGYSLQANRKTREGTDHEDRDAQFGHINRQVMDYQQHGQPVISVDTKKKELVGDFKNGGREWQPHGHPEAVRTHDFIDRELGKVNPYGVYDPTLNAGWVSVGTDHDTAEFAVESIRRWWRKMGCPAYPKAKQLLITADGGGSNGYRVRLWKVALQRLANDTGLSLRVCHFPPGTSKWNSATSEDWRIQQESVLSG